MLIPWKTLERIKAGEVDLAFRRWRRASVREGGTLKTAVGVLRIERVERIGPGDISESDAKRAGAASRTELMRELDRREGDLFRITISFGGDDPRIALREAANLSDDDLAEILKRLERLDSRSREGAWTRRVLTAIAEHPHQPAVELARVTGHPKERLKLNVRKLKNMGLTVSHHPGYSLAPRGEVVLARLLRKGPPPPLLPDPDRL